MTDDLSTLLARASTPPPAPMEQFLATIPASAGAGTAASARRLAWLSGFGVAAAAALVVVAGGATILSLRPDPAAGPVAASAAGQVDEPLIIAASDLDLLAEEAGYSETDAFAATLSGDLVAMGLAETP